MATVAVRCPRCGSEEVIKRGKTDSGRQRYLCRNEACDQNSFLLDYRYPGYRPEIKRQVAAMAMNGRGVRDTARVLGISTGTVLRELKKSRPLSSR